MNVFVLTLFFACGRGCGVPAQVTLPADVNGKPFASMSECEAAGNAWLSAAANPGGAIRSFNCTTRKK